MDCGGHISLSGAGEWSGHHHTQVHGFKLCPTRAWPPAVRRARPGPRDVRPGNRDAPATSQRNGVRGCPLARRKGNVVSYTLLQKRRSQKQRLKRRSASRALCWTHEKAARLFVAARVITQHWPGRRPMPMMHPRGKCVRHPPHHCASTNYSSPSSATARQNDTVNGPIFTDGKSFQCLDLYCSLTLVSLPNSKYLTPAPPRQHPDPAR